MKQASTNTVRCVRNVGGAPRPMPKSPAPAASSSHHVEADAFPTGAAWVGGWRAGAAADLSAEAEAAVGDALVADLSAVAEAVGFGSGGGSRTPFLSTV